jgi:hypothetical protein
VNFGSAEALSSLLTGDTAIEATTPALQPGALHDVIVVRNEDNAQGTLPRGFFADFVDMPQTHPFHDFVEKIFREGITAGCGAGLFCPGQMVTRSQMAIFLLRGIHGGSYVPPAATGTRFTDVPADGFGAAFIEQLAADGITAGCEAAEFCPDAPVMRAQMAVFLLRAKHGASYTPPPATGIFDDVSVDSPFAPWIEQLFSEEITAGCEPQMYCPSDPVTRGQMAIFLSRTFAPPE